MDYPAIPYSIESTDTRADPILLSTARSGAPKARRLYPAPRRSFVITHHGLTDAQKQTLEDFLTANRMVPFTIVYPCRVGGVSYPVIEETGMVEWSKADGKWSTNIAVVQA